MADFFVMSGNDYTGTASSDSNDGRDPAGFGLTTATYNDSTKTLTQTNAFTNYTWQSGDLIYISGGTNATPGLYEIAGKTDNSNITLTTSAGSTDATGDWTSSSGPFATIQKLFDTVDASDVGRICNDATYTTDAQLDFDLNSYANTNPSNKIQTMAFVGASSRGVLTDAPNQNIATIKVGTFAGATTNLIQIGAQSIDHVTWRDIVFDGARTSGTNDAQDCVNSGAAAANGGWVFINCRFTGCSRRGLSMRGSSQDTTGVILGCEFDNCGNEGYRDYVDYRSAYMFVECSFHDNGSDGARIGPKDALVLDCVFYDNTGNGLYFPNELTVARPNIVRNCTFYGNGGDGLDNGDATSGRGETYFVHNCTACANTGYGFRTNAKLSPVSLWGWNHTNGNTAGAWSNERGVNNQTGAPNFTSVTDGSEDFEPTSGSALLDNGDDLLPSGGPGSQNIGAVQPAYPAAATTIISRPRRMI